MASEGALLIGIGNPLRGDDGVGGFLVEELARERGVKGPLGVELRSVHQLTPELAPLVADASRVLFVDAWASSAPAQPWIETLLSPASGEPTPSPGLGSHGLDPIVVLSIARSLYGWRGEGALLRVPAYAFPHGSGFSAPLKRALPRARDLVRLWLRRR